MDKSLRQQQLGAALAALKAERWGISEALCRGLLLRDPTDLEGSLLFGFALAGKGDTGNAASVLHDIARRHPDAAHPCTDFATLCPNGPAGPLYRACLTLAPGNTRLRRDFAAFLLDRDGAPEAADVLRGALDTAAGQHAMGLALTELGRFREAIPHFQCAAERDPVPSLAWANLGMVLKIEGRYDEALAAYHQAIARSPNDAAIRVNRMVALLQAGRWPEAWQGGDWRLRLPGYHGLPENRLLSNVEDVRGRTILLTHEEGFGDTIQFLRYAPLLAKRGATVLVSVPAALERLARHVPGIVKVLPAGAPVPDYDYHCPMVSLPRAFGTTPETIPPGDYLRADTAPLPGPLRVGLVWAGQARPWLPGFTALDSRRSAGAKIFSPLAAVPNARFVGLQMGEAAAHPPPGLCLTDPMPNVRDFADTAALLAGLDLVISVDTAVVHLAGAMGKPVFMLDRYDHCWRWFSGRADSPWYPELTIFRQNQPGDWAAPMHRLVATVTRLAATRAHPSPAPECPNAA